MSKVIQLQSEHLSTEIKLHNKKLENLIGCTKKNNSHLVSPLVNAIELENASIISEVGAQPVSKNSESLTTTQLEHIFTDAITSLDTMNMSNTSASSQLPPTENNHAGMCSNIHSAATSSLGDKTKSLNDMSPLIRDNLSSLNDNNSTHAGMSQTTTADNANLDKTMSNSNLNTGQHHFHLSRLSVDTTTDMIYKYMRDKGVLPNSKIKVTKLVPRNRDISTLSFVSFKIDTNDDVAEKINTPNFWPQLIWHYCSWKNFIPKPRPLATFANIDPFLGEGHSSQMPT